jgi:hypothetical protein
VLFLDGGTVSRSVYQVFPLCGFAAANPPCFLPILPCFSLEKYLFTTAYEICRLETAGCDDKLQPEVWQTAPAAPFSQQLLELQ